MRTYAGLAARRVDGDGLADLQDTLVFLHRQPVKLAPRAVVRGKPVGECWRGIFNRCVFMKCLLKAPSTGVFLNQCVFFTSLLLSACFNKFVF
jgi:hypothetical protein